MFIIHYGLLVIYLNSYSKFHNFEQMLYRRKLSRNLIWYFSWSPDLVWSDFEVKTLEVIFQAYKSDSGPVRTQNEGVCRTPLCGTNLFPSSAKNVRYVSERVRRSGDLRWRRWRYTTLHNPAFWLHAVSLHGNLERYRRCGARRRRRRRRRRCETSKNGSETDSYFDCQKSFWKCI